MTQMNPPPENPGRFISNAGWLDDPRSANNRIFKITLPERNEMQALNQISSHYGSI